MIFVVFHYCCLDRRSNHRDDISPHHHTIHYCYRCCVRLHIDQWRRNNHLFRRYHTILCYHHIHRNYYNPCRHLFHRCNIHRRCKMKTKHLPLCSKANFQESLLFFYCATMAAWQRRTLFQYQHYNEQLISLYADGPMFLSRHCRNSKEQ